MSTCGDESVPTTPDVREDGCPPLEPAACPAREHVRDTYPSWIFAVVHDDPQCHDVPERELNESNRLPGDELWSNPLVWGAYIPRSQGPVDHRLVLEMSKRAISVKHHEPGPPKVDWPVETRRIPKVKYQ